MCVYIYIVIEIERDTYIYIYIYNHLLDEAVLHAEEPVERVGEGVAELRVHGAEEVEDLMCICVCGEVSYS